MKLRVFLDIVFHHVPELQTRKIGRRTIKGI
jgi:hypothetical protein